MVTQALLVGLVMFIGLFSDNGLGDPMIKRPLVMGALTGFVLGDLEAGVKMGASLEVIFLGITGIGGALPSDSMTGSIFGTAFAILSNQGVEVALTLAVPISLLATFITNIVNIGIAGLMGPVDTYIAEGNQKKVTFIHYFCMIGKPFIFGVVGFLGIMIGSDAVSAFVDSIPKVIMSGLTVTGQMLPALGMGVLLNMLWDKKIAVFVLLGFVMIAYLKMPLIAIALVGTVIAVYTAYKEVDQKQKTVVATNVTDNDEEDFFNE